MNRRIRLIASCLLLAATPPLAHAAAPPSLARPFSLGSQTSTYVRCYYRIDPRADRPKANWTWAVTPAGDYFALPGRWAYPSLESSNLFFTDINHATLVDRCHDTLRREGRGDILQSVVAADTQLSYDYAIWHNDRPGASPGITRMIVFGDSLSDMMNIWNRTLGVVPNRTSWAAGRFSNGDVWPEQTAFMTGLDLLNLAFGNATSDGNEVLPGVQQQVDIWRKLKATSPGIDASRTVHVVFVGGNDFTKGERSAVESLASVESSLRALVRDGASRMLVMNLPDISLAPDFRGSARAEAIRREIAVFNAGLPAIRQRLAALARVDIFDTHALFDEVMASPSRFGLDNVTDSCLAIPAGASLPYASEQRVNTACLDADRYAFWDRVHPTRRMHAILGEAVADFLASLEQRRNE